ncbi:EF hand domain-containing protein [Calycina marina]|uniref:EF hand domain-containing protein n=1 Tax=Calycina marina TaxID=1763456 RepID=A0A9P7YVN4_9HELO|nr:EF hand domain-containing protein [Calycina marina]
MSALSPVLSILTTRRRNSIIGTIVILLGAGYCYYIDSSSRGETPASGGSPGLHRSNALYRPRRNASGQQGFPITEPPELPHNGDHDEDSGIVAQSEEVAETVADDEEFEDHEWDFPSMPDGRAGQNILQLLFRVSENASSRSSVVHRGCGCNACGEVPIRGTRYRCANCADYDLCELCESQEVHIKTHIFYKIRMPAPTFAPGQIIPVWYTGDPNVNHKTLSKELVEKLTKDTGFERPALDAYWEQWKYMANKPWTGDPDGLQLAMDKYTFERCLVPSGSYRHPSPNIIFDRMFSIYDTNKDGLISFSEFVHGLAYRKKKDKWRKVFDGYDVDEDGYVDRKDFLRIFRAYYVLYQQMHRDMLERMNNQAMNSTQAHRVVTGRKPLSSAFGEAGEWAMRETADPRSRVGRKSVDSNTEELMNLEDEELVKENGNERTSVTTRESTVRTFLGQITGEDRLQMAPRRYWDAMMNPNSSALQSHVDHSDQRNQNDLDAMEMTGFGRPHYERPQENDGDLLLFPEDDEWPPTFVTITDADMESAGIPLCDLENVPKLQRQDLITHAVHRERIETQMYDRWRRRQFYTEEEEGAQPPANWKEEDEVFPDRKVGVHDMEEHSKAKIRSRSSSKVRFVDDIDAFDNGSNHSSSSRSMPERWGGMEISEAERDAGKEILYQVTQEAFSQLLDPLFKHSEDLALIIAETTGVRDQYRDTLFSDPEFLKLTEKMEKQEKEFGHELGNGTETLNLPTQTRSTHVEESSATATRSQNPIWPGFQETELEDVRGKTLEDLLSASGYEVQNVVGYLPATSIPQPAFDPTMPQFRPDNIERSETIIAEDTENSPINSSSSGGSEYISNPTPELIYQFQLWKLEKKFNEVNKRGGFGRINFQEFEAEVKKHFKNEKGSEMDYLGSWIDFCIP